jgi:hypothetical protein
MGTGVCQPAALSFAEFFKLAFEVQFLELLPAGDETHCQYFGFIFACWSDRRLKLVLMTETVCPAGDTGALGFIELGPVPKALNDLVPKGIATAIGKQCGEARWHRVIVSL